MTSLLHLRLKAIHSEVAISICMFFMNFRILFYKSYIQINIFIFTMDSFLEECFWLEPLFLSFLYCGTS